MSGTYGGLRTADAWGVLARTRWGTNTDDVSTVPGSNHSGQYHNRYHNLVAAPGASRRSTFHALPRFSLEALYRYPRRSMAKDGTCLKIMVSPVRIRVSPLMKILQNAGN
jgi:hypothetical protein